MAARMDSTTDATRLLHGARQGSRGDADRLIALVYEQLRHLAARHMAAERADHTLQPTALAHEAYLRLVHQDQVDWRDRAHFLAIASEMIRRILVDHSRRKGALKRGGERCRVGLDGVEPELPAANGTDLLALDQALEELARLNDRQRRIVEMRFFGGLTIEETAEALGVSPGTVKTDWAMARAWLRQWLEKR